MLTKEILDDVRNVLPTCADFESELVEFDGKHADVTRRIFGPHVQVTCWSHEYILGKINSERDNTYGLPHSPGRS
ncbi:hypothetical protein [Paraburkholderia humisilvae]|uniref:hypothetical protein n=1 Tax=Paraburkholderia humisilvae TaxID=627669 RepID=UPI001FEC6D8A|nr:hypothetical protein [Paraburkholderia humisilvae]